MTDREKLVAWMEEAYYCSIEELADHLLSNGVVVREKGEWELVEFQSCPLDTDQALVCSCCGFAHKYDAWFNFCPNCGADMRKGENDG